MGTRSSERGGLRASWRRGLCGSVARAAQAAWPPGPLGGRGADNNELSVVFSYGMQVLQLHPDTPNPQISDADEAS
jgi:hypothetical protein